MGKARVNKHTNLQSTKTSFNISQLLFLAALFSFIVAMPFLKGLMIGLNSGFSENLNTSFLLTSAIVVLFSIYVLNKKAEDEKTYIQHLIWLLPVCSLLSQLNAASSYFAGLSTLVAVQAAFLFIVSYYINRDEQLQKLLFNGLYISAFIIVIYGFMNWFNDASVFGLFPQTYPDAVWDSGTGKRLSSIFQYPNTYAAFLILFGLVCLFTATLSTSWKQRLIFALPLVPTFVSLLLTTSRWGWLSFPVILVLCLPFLGFKKQLQAIILLAITGILTILALNPITNFGLELQEQFTYGKAALAWLILLGSASLVAVAAVGIASIFNKKITDEQTDEETKQITILSRLIIPVTSVIVGVIGAVLLFSTSLVTKLLPASIAERVTSINFNQHSVLERFTFYRDALELFKAYPLLGSGGGGWSSLYQMYQNNPYISFEVHSYFVQLLVEKGLNGFVITLALFIIIYCLFLRTVFKYKRFSIISFSWFIIATTILLNSTLDFHMSYAYIYALLFIALGGMLAHADLPLVKLLNEKLSTLNKRLNKKAIIIVYLIAGLGFGAVALSNLSATSTYDKAQATLNQVPFIETQALAEKAAKRMPHPDHLDYHVQLLIEGYKAFNKPELLDSAKNTIEDYQRKEPYNERLIRNKLTLYKLEQNHELMIEELERATQYYIWDIYYYEHLAMQYSQILSNAFFAGDAAKQQEMTNKIMQLEKTVLEKSEHLKTLPEEQLQGRQFNMTKPIAGVIGQAYYIQEQYELANRYLAESYDATYSFESSAQATLYLAALNGKRGTSYTELLNELVSSTGLDTDIIQAQIEALIGLKPLTP